jgi:hypothetical protein
MHVYTCTRIYIPLSPSLSLSFLSVKKKNIISIIWISYYYLYFYYLMGASGNSNIRAYIYLGTYMREHKPRLKGCGQDNIFLCDIFVDIFFINIKKYRPGRDQANIFYTRFMHCIMRHLHAYKILSMVIRCDLIMNNSEVWYGHI